MFALAPIIVPFFSQDETAGGPSKIKVWRRGTWTEVNGRRVPGPKIRVNVIGNIAPVSQKDIDHFAQGKLREGDIWIFTNVELRIADEATQQTSDLVEHFGDFFRIDTVDNWHYAKGFRFVGRRERGESGV
jgi:hypothetical protein